MTILILTSLKPIIWTENEEDIKPCTDFTISENFSIAQFGYLVSESGRKGRWSVFMQILRKSTLIVTLFQLIGIVGCVSGLLLPVLTAGS